MKAPQLFLLAAGSIFLAGVGLQAAATDKASTADKAMATAKPVESVTVNFKDPDKFTDVLEGNSDFTSTAYLDELRACVQENAALVLTPGQKLTVTFLDIDLAGDTRTSGPSHTRLIKPIYVPRMSLEFQLVDANGKVIKEGKRQLTDLNFQDNINFVDRNEPMFYDKYMLKKWIRDEFFVKKKN